MSFEPQPQQQRPRRAPAPALSISPESETVQAFRKALGREVVICRTEWTTSRAEQIPDFLSILD